MSECSSAVSVVRSAHSGPRWRSRRTAQPCRLRRTMTTQDGTYQRLTVAEAAAELGVSRMTVRRMIQRGQLEAERVHRPQGSLYVVRLPVDGTGQGTPTAQVPGHRARHNG